MMEFVVEIYDAATECISDEFRVELDDVCGVLNLKNFDDGESYDLDSVDLEKLNKFINGNLIKNEKNFIRLRYKSDFDDLPYLLHTGRELQLMLDGKKPLSVFTGAYPPCLEFEEIPERLFDAYVEKGVFLKGEHIEPVTLGSAQMIRRVLYALPSEYWRINAYNMMLHVAKRSGWHEGFERMEGSLLGYNDEQNDSYIEFLRGRSKIK